ncbi:lipopolysaccharide heptosyltransferase [Neoasaia chiangmaiensis NBRC 101099]|uniref:Glycosyl transferase n=1 Tax=Neoasaia chiangmaiensis TaxID=320497 RepID=A0A1U9KQJ7_9PROT|nr:glycosyltransferase family 9 protein [Neoasaia chiangmaiensis]AQS88073.1 glycosyl transferase [Neoasaia chiangmaiensis]GBR38744.1 lipopolysaccharide heptosyltransferase [Neoasaia chiangmaiensis NBRC 101099]GEN15751.1 glycosyl transferase [Neoasaia chiangmaiensis]
MLRILVIKLGALGDFVLSFGPFAAIRAAFPHAEITLLTTSPYRAMAETSPWFDRVVIDTRPAWHDFRGIWRLRQALAGFDRVFDLQTSGRSSRYFRLAGNPPWSGIAPGCTLPHDNPWRDDMHTIARQRDQLIRAGIAPVPYPDLTWLSDAGPRLDQPYALLVPGAAPHRPAKRWPAKHFGALALRLAERGIRPVVIGTAADSETAATITSICPRALDLTGQTDLTALGGLAARAQRAIGNDTGPMHLAAAMGCRATVLFSGESNPRLTAPVGRTPGQVDILRAPDLTDLPVSKVAESLNP